MDGAAGPRGKTGDTGATGPEGPSVSRRTTYGAAVIFASILILAGGSVQYTAYRAHRDDQRWCAVITSVDDTYREAPPTTDAGRLQAANFHRLRIDLGCK